MKRKNPHLLEINAFHFLDRISQKYGRRLTLAEIPQEEWDLISAQGFHYVWLMGVWMRSPAARQRALEDERLQESYSHALPDWTEADVIGSPYAIYYYEMDPRLGVDGDLAKVRGRMSLAGLGLVLDFVSNHMAYDHVWTGTRPDAFVKVDAETQCGQPELFFQTPQGLCFAHGRDPYFPAWNDTVQVNFFSESWRNAAVEILLNIAAQADGVRCDMAMLGLNQIFENVWGRFLTHPRPPHEFWEKVIRSVKAKHPEFIFIAEAYWDQEWNLQQLGFDFTYDKRLYDRLLGSTPSDIRGHLTAEKTYQEKSVRFIENHDEARAFVKFGREKSYAAAIVSMTAPGMRFVHDGQALGKKIHVPIQLAREPEEKTDPETASFYKMLLKYISREVFQSGEWKLLEVFPDTSGDRTFSNLLAWSWRDEKSLRLIIINYSAVPSRGSLKLPSGWLGVQGMVQLLDHASGVIYQSDAGQMTDPGLGAVLKPWKAHLFEAKKIFEGPRVRP